MPSNHLILCCPLLLLPSIFPSIRVFSNQSVLHIRWPKYWSFSFSISPSNEYSGLISFRIGWFDVLAVQGTSKSLLQHHSSKALILLCSVSFMVQLSHPSVQFSSFQSLSRVSLQPHGLQHTRLPCPSPPHPLSSPSPLPSIFPSIRVFSNQSALCIRWPKYWNFSFSISPSNEYSGLITFRIDWFDLFAVQGTLKSLLQYHSSKA